MRWRLSRFTEEGAGNVSVHVGLQVATMGFVRTMESEKRVLIVGQEATGTSQLSCC
ncbi:hypothetical protein F442_11377 [Phytophthora nicotianae P10297]|uniref:Uncharacterized protein n=2 Tax=Phytophthora nicotianae TaxID=4792 RepID=V9F7L8_PHYNI|nr:hypothetical protein F443_08324 [Phytophthora nicotianae P1569]ETP41533.1 hypothetical protein F442_11377 [Phytophthora nicotianae P10297]